ncbi:unnamed protein product [Rodentolepis nana]|uniref:Protein kinase domain-containing protein n=1 Tax=Rodentolepis nana TaxID=102285 RepID=A0A0R3TNJ7_RODNA|nr:unnamed protein product [Rodentolepis nana]
MMVEERCRSNSNHRCCYDARYRNGPTAETTESSKSASRFSSRISNGKRRHSVGSKKYSSGYGCSQSKKPFLENVDRRHKRSSPALSYRKSRPPGSTIRNGKDSHLPEGKHSSPPFHNGDGPRSSKRHHEHSQKRHHYGSPTHSSHRRKRQRRSKERVKQKASHDHHHKRDKESPVIPLGKMIKHRFEVRKVLGEGSFGQVLECFDISTHSQVAVKALKRLEDYQEAAKHEADILNLIAKSGTYNGSNCIHAVDFFEWHCQYFIIFPLLSTSVFNLLEQNDYEPYPMDYVISISRQLCEAVGFMQKLGICHTDLKPENIMFTSHEFIEVPSTTRDGTIRLVKDPQIKVIDFGSAVTAKERHSKTIQTRHYRAPEVILEIGWSYPADIWSVGCIIYEVLTGQCLFMTHDNLEHLAMMQRFIGPLPREMVDESRRRRYFRHGRLDWDEDSSAGRYVRKNVRFLGDIWLSTQDLLTSAAYDLIKAMLRYVPKKRITPQVALTHSLFK